MIKAIIKITDKNNKSYVSITFGLSEEEITKTEGKIQTFTINENFIVAEKIEILSFVRGEISPSNYNRMATFFAEKYKAEPNLIKNN